MIGEKFGRLVVLKKTDKRNSSRAIILLCKCECGNEYLAPSTTLRNGRTRSCGCLNSEITASDVVHESIVNNYRSYLLAKKETKLLASKPPCRYKKFIKSLI